MRVARIWRKSILSHLRTRRKLWREDRTWRRIYHTLYTQATGGVMAGMNKISTGALPDGDGLFETL